MIEQFYISEIDGNCEQFRRQSSTKLRIRTPFAYEENLSWFSYFSKIHNDRVTIQSFQSHWAKMRFYFKLKVISKFPSIVESKYHLTRHSIWRVVQDRLVNMIQHRTASPLRLRIAEGHFVAHAPRKFVRRVRRHFDIFSALLRVFNWAIDTFLWYFLERDERVWQVYHHS